jgi:hypothetical protein
MLRLFDTSAAFTKTWMLDMPLRVAMRTLDRLWRKAHAPEIQHYIWRVLYSLFWGICLVCYATMELYYSYLAEVFWLFATLFWGLCKLFIVRRDSPLTGYENTWTFGQVVGMALLILPVMAATEIYADVQIHQREASQHGGHIEYAAHGNDVIPDKQRSKFISQGQSTEKDHHQETGESGSFEAVFLPKRAATDITEYSTTSQGQRSIPFRYANTLPAASTTSLTQTTPVAFANTLPAGTSSTIDPIASQPDPLPFTNTLPAPSTTLSDPTATPKPPHATTPYTSPFFILLLILLAALPLVPFIIFIELVFALSNQFTAAALVSAVMIWGIALAGAVPGWMLLGILGGSGLWGDNRERRGPAGLVVRGGIWLRAKVGGRPSRFGKRSKRQGQGASGGVVQEVEMSLQGSDAQENEQDVETASLEEHEQHGSARPGKGWWQQGPGKRKKQWREDADAAAARGRVASTVA